MAQCLSSDDEWMVENVDTTFKHSVEKANDLLKQTPATIGDHIKDAVKMMLKLETRHFIEAITHLLKDSKYDKTRKIIKSFFKSLRRTGQIKYLYKAFSEFIMFMLIHGVDLLIPAMKHVIKCQNVNGMYYHIRMKALAGLSFIRIIMFELYTQYISRIRTNQRELNETISLYKQKSRYHFEWFGSPGLESEFQSHEKSMLREEDVYCKQRCGFGKAIAKMAIEKIAVKYHISDVIIHNNTVKLYPSDKSFKHAKFMLRRYKYLDGVKHLIHMLKSRTHYHIAIDRLLKHTEHYDKRDEFKKVYDELGQNSDSGSFYGFIAMCIKYLLCDYFDDLDVVIERYFNDRYDEQNHIFVGKIKAVLPLIRILINELHDQHISYILTREFELRYICHQD